jgi:hypothetical protein
MTEPKITSRLKEKLMASVASFYRRRPAAEVSDPTKRSVQRTPDRESTMPRVARPSHDDVQ